MNSRCDYAACTQRAVAAEQTWQFCAIHFAEHRADFGGEPPTLRVEIARLHSHGMPDAHIAAELRCDRSTVAYHRKAMALPANSIQKGPTATRPCGTPAAARRHHRHGEPLCDPCRAAVRKHAYPPVMNGRRYAS